MMSESFDSVANPFASVGNNAQLRLNTADQQNGDSDVSPLPRNQATVSSPGGVGSNDVPLILGSGTSSGFTGQGFTPGTGGASMMCMNSAMPLTDVHTKLDHLKQWSISTYKCTKQALSEKLGKSQKTVDIEVDQSIETLRDLQRRYASLVGLVRTFTTFFQNMVTSQKQMVDSFTELSQRDTELHEQFKYNAETQRNLIKNGETLVNAMQFFMSSMNTLCDKTIEDTLITVRNYETARLEYDAYREDLAALQHASGSQSAGDTQMKLHQAEQVLEEHKKRYEKLRQDVQVKIRFVDENRVKVVQKQLLLFHNATAAYFSGNQKGLDAAMKQFSIKPQSGNAMPSSFLENEHS